MQLRNKWMHTSYDMSVLHRYKLLIASIHKMKVCKFKMAFKASTYGVASEVKVVHYGSLREGKKHNPIWQCKKWCFPQNSNLQSYCQSLICILTVILPMSKSNSQQYTISNLVLTFTVITSNLFHWSANLIYVTPLFNL